MRLTADDALASYVMVTLDGVDVTNYCTVADEAGEHGSVERFQLIFGKLTPFTTYGTVVITLRPDAPEWVKNEYLRRRLAEAVPNLPAASWGWPTWRWPS